MLLACLKLQDFGGVVVIVIEIVMVIVIVGENKVNS
jgi:hypothetical protein